jgi:hypothetical protein
MAITLEQRLKASINPNLSLEGLVPAAANVDPNVPTINDSFEKGTYDQTLRSLDAKAASRITPLPKRP